MEQENSNAEGSDDGDMARFSDSSTCSAKLQFTTASQVGLCDEVYGQQGNETGSDDPGNESTGTSSVDHGGGKMGGKRSGDDLSDDCGYVDNEEFRGSEQGYEECNDIGKADGNEPRNEPFDDDGDDGFGKKIINDEPGSDNANEKEIKKEPPTFLNDSG